MPNISFNLIAIAFDIKFTQCDFAYTTGERASTRLEDTLVGIKTKYLFPKI